MLGDDMKKSKIESLLAGAEGGAEAEEEDDDTDSDTTMGDALLEAIESKDAKQIGKSIRSAVKLCSYAKDED